MNTRRQLSWTVAAVAGLACLQLACSLKSLDYLKSGSKPDARDLDAITDGPAPTASEAGSFATGGAGPALTGTGGGGGTGRTPDGAADVAATETGQLSSTGGVAAAGGRGSGGVTGSGGRGGAAGSGGRGGSAGGAGSSGRGGSGGTVATGGKSGTGGVGTGGKPPGSGGTGSGGATTSDAAVSICRGGQDANATDTQLAQGLLAHYPCEQASGTALPDVSGNRRDATLSGSPSFTGGRVGNALVLDGSRSQYAELPAGILADACEMTIASWIYISGHNQWQRAWDVGNDTQSYMFLTPDGSASGTLRFAITVAGGGGEQKLEVKDVFHTRQWTHVVVVLGSAGAIVYVNGVQAGADMSVTLRPADLGLMTKSYIGKSQYTSDPTFDGRIDELRMYNRALAASEVLALYNER